MRGGTSFVGDLFNQHGGAFYWYEPLDGAYSALFGTPYGWTPLDITHTLDGEPRWVGVTSRDVIPMFDIYALFVVNLHHSNNISVISWQ